MGSKKVLMILSNASALDDFNKTGVWLEEFAVPYYRLKEEGYDITVASPLGGDVPIDETSLLCENPTEWDYLIPLLKNTTRFDAFHYHEYDGLFLPGGHGPLIDLAVNDLLGEIVSYFYNDHKPIAAICHGPAGLLRAKTIGNEPIVKKRKVTSFTNKEEKLAGKDKVVPFLLETALKKLGANFEESVPMTEHVVVDENLITGQNQNSSKLIADIFIKKLSL